MFEVKPVYVCFLPLCSVTVALYITWFSKHLPCTGHSSLDLQLHVFCCSCFCGFRSLEFWADIAAPILGVHLYWCDLNEIANMLRIQ